MTRFQRRLFISLGLIVFISLGITILSLPVGWLYFLTSTGRHTNPFGYSGLQTWIIGTVFSVIGLVTYKVRQWMLSQYHAIGDEQDG
jgi:hypothetical protein